MTNHSRMTASRRHALKTGVTAAALISARASWASDAPETPDIRFGIIALTDCSPIVIAHEKGLFKKYGINSTVAKQASWAAVRDALSNGDIQATHMLVGMPIASTLGLLGSPRRPMVIPWLLNRNGQSITLEAALKGKVQADPKALLPLVMAAKAKGEPMTFAMTFPPGTHAMWVRYWLAAGGINPDKDVALVTIPPAQMVANMKVGKMNGYCVGEPWNARAVADGIGYTAINTQDIWKDHPEKVCAMTADFANRNPKTVKATTPRSTRAPRPDDRHHQREGDPMRFHDVTVCILLAGGVASAAEPGPAPPTVVATPGAPPAAPPAPPYSLPWQLRPVTVGNVIRSDTSVAFYEGKNAAGESAAGATIASMLLGTWKLTPSLAPLVRVAVVQNSAPDLAMGAPSGVAFVNPLVGGTYAVKLADFRLASFLGATIPVGMGGGKDPSPGATEAASKGIAARSGMDNALFAVNYFTGIAGIGAGWVAHGATVQLEATVLQLRRVRGPDTQDADRTNFTAGLHLGYTFLSWLSTGGELRYQRWLSTPAAVTRDATARDTITFAIGPRFHYKLGNGAWIRPGISYGRGLDAPLSRASYDMVQVDVPVVF